jgi:hypothetical protein
MNKILAFLNKIVGLMVFLILCLLLVFGIHGRHHWRGRHHGMMRGHMSGKDSAYSKQNDSTYRK